MDVSDRLLTRLGAHDDVLPGDGETGLVEGVEVSDWSMAEKS
jgi:hypothetical protein